MLKILLIIITIISLQIYAIIHLNLLYYLSFFKVNSYIIFWLLAVFIVFIFYILNILFYVLFMENKNIKLNKNIPGFIYNFLEDLKIISRNKYRKKKYTIYFTRHLILNVILFIIFIFWL
jgi:glycopeptide antibiotics resistance protein